MWVQGAPLKVCEEARSERRQGGGASERTGPASQGRRSPGLCAHPAPLVPGAGGEALAETRVWRVGEAPWGRMC